jgi:hypothetical protein
VNEKERDQHHGPKSKHHLHFTQQMPYPCMVGLLARQTLKKLRGKGMDYSQSEEKAADDIDGGGVHG